MNVSRFESDLSKLARRLTTGEESIVRARVGQVKSDLVKMYRENLVKINHSVIELVAAKHLILQGYDVRVEHKISQNLVCDLYGKRTGSDILVEIETGFVPPAHALDPVTYCSARIASKTARYSPFAKRFVLGTTQSNILTIPKIYIEHTPSESMAEAEQVKALCDRYYNSPPIETEAIIEERLNAIYVIDVDRGDVLEVSPAEYREQVEHLKFRLHQDPKHFVEPE